MSDTHRFRWMEVNWSIFHYAGCFCGWCQPTSQGPPQTERDALALWDGHVREQALLAVAEIPALLQIIAERLDRTTVQRALGEAG